MTDPHGSQNVASAPGSLMRSCHCSCVLGPALPWDHTSHHPMPNTTFRSSRRALPSPPDQGAGYPLCIRSPGELDSAIRSEWHPRRIRIRRRPAFQKQKCENSSELVLAMARKKGKGEQSVGEPNGANRLRTHGSYHGSHLVPADGKRRRTPKTGVQACHTCTLVSGGCDGMRALQIDGDPRLRVTAALVWMDTCDSRCRPLDGYSRICALLQVEGLLARCSRVCWIMNPKSWPQTNVSTCEVSWPQIGGRSGWPHHSFFHHHHPKRE